MAMMFVFFIDTLTTSKGCTLTVNNWIFYVSIHMGDHLCLVVLYLAAFLLGCLVSCITQTMGCSHPGLDTPLLRGSV